MHEGMLVKGLVRKVNEVALASHAARVKSVTLSAGEYSHCSPDHLREHFALEAAGTVSEGATVHFRDRHPDDTDALELVLESIEIEPHECTDA